MPIREERPTHTMFYARAEAPLSPQARGAVDKLYRAAGMLLPEGANILFDSFSIADADLAFMLHRLILNGHDVPGNLRSYAESHWRRPSVQKFLNRSRPEYVAY